MIKRLIDKIRDKRFMEKGLTWRQLRKSEKEIFEDCEDVDEKKSRFFKTMNGSITCFTPIQ